MDPDIANTIEVLAAKVRTKEEETNKLKKLINELCSEAGLEPRYSNITETSSGLGSLRRDQFYGQAITAAARNYLEMRKASNLGAASVTEIYRAIRDGGYKFETKDEENAKNTVRISLRKNSSIFHRLPNGDYGLLVWYPNAKPSKEEDEDDKAADTTKSATKSSKRASKRTSKPVAKKVEPNEASAEKAETPAKPISNGKPVNGAAVISQAQIREVIFGTSGEFQTTEIEDAVKARFPSQPLTPNAVSYVIHTLKKKQQLRIVSEPVGNKGATYCKA